MQYLSKKCVVHRDLAARNVLVCEEKAGTTFVKISDFGLSEANKSGSTYTQKRNEVTIVMKMLAGWG